MKKVWSTILLVVLAVVLGVWLYVDRDSISAGERGRRENSVFSAWRRDELSRIELGVDNETIVLVREAKENAPWRMTSPRVERADPTAVEHLLTTLEFANVVRKVGSGTDLGLEAPRVRGSLTMGSLVMRFTLGGESPRPEGSSYFRVDDAPPIVVARELAEALLRGADVYRDRSVVPYLSLELARVAVTYEGGSFSLERLDENAFRVGELGVLASKTALDETVWGAFAAMRAEAFPKDTDIERLTTHPAVTITMTPKEPGKPAAELVIGEPCPGHPDDLVVLRRAPTRTAACAPKMVLSALRVTPASLVDKKPVALRPDEIAELRFERVADVDGGASDAASVAPATLELARKGTGYKERVPEDRDLSADEADAADELLARITSSEADAVSSGGDTPFVAIARLRVRSGDEREEVVDVGALGQDGRATFRRARDGARLGVAAAVWRRFVARATSTKPRWMLTEKTRVSRAVLACGTRQELVDKGEGFRLMSPAGFETDSSIVELVDALTHGKVDAWVSDTNEAAFGLASEACRVTLDFEGGVTKTVRFGVEGEGGVYGVVEPGPEVFVAPRSTRVLAERIYVSRAALRVAPERIDRVTVTKDGRKVVGLDSELLRHAASGLYADRAVAVGKGAVFEQASLRTLVIDMTTGDGGPKKHVSCTSSGKERLCVVDGVDASFGVAEAKLAPFEKPAEAPNLARDGGSR